MHGQAECRHFRFGHRLGQLLLPKLCFHLVFCFFVRHGHRLYRRLELQDRCSTAEPTRRHATFKSRRRKLPLDYPVPCGPVWRFNDVPSRGAGLHKPLRGHDISRGMKDRSAQASIFAFGACLMALTAAAALSPAGAQSARPASRAAPSADLVLCRPAGRRSGRSGQARGDQGRRRDRAVRRSAGAEILQDRGARVAPGAVPARPRLRRQSTDARGDCRLP